MIRGHENLLARGPGIRVGSGATCAYWPTG